MKLLATLSILAFATSISAGTVDTDYGYNDQANEWDIFLENINYAKTDHQDVLVSQPSVGDSADDEAISEIFFNAND